MVDSPSEDRVRRSYRVRSVRSPSGFAIRRTLIGFDLQVLLGVVAFSVHHLETIGQDAPPTWTVGLRRLSPTEESCSLRLSKLEAAGCVETTREGLSIAPPMARLLNKGRTAFDGYRRQMRNLVNSPPK
jgi:hypothetical protein